MSDRLEFPQFDWHNLEMVIGYFQLTIQSVNLARNSKDSGEVLVFNVKSAVVGDSENCF
jgi:hypothetical protein